MPYFYPISKLIYTITFLVQKKMIKYEKSKHAEIDAILKLPINTNMRKVKLLVVRDGLKMSKPCELCDKVIKELGIKRVYYSCNGVIEKL